MSMNKSKGVLTLIYGKPEYARQAVNLARSIRLRDPNLPLAVATDLDPALFEEMYDHVIPGNSRNGRAGLRSWMDVR